MKLHTKPTSLSPNPLEVFENLAGNHEYCFLLETLGDENQSQNKGRSYIGVDPTHHFAAMAGHFYIDGQAESADDPYQALTSRISFEKDLPASYVGGLVGYLSHEAIHYGEPELKFPYQRDFPDFEFGQYDDGLVFQDDRPPVYFHYGQDRSKLYEANTKQASKLKIDFVSAAKSEGRYQDMVNKARDDIQNGRVFQAVLANKYEYRFAGDLLELYKQLRLINPSSFMFFLKFGDVITLGASPELLTHTMPSGETYIEALAGTIRRGKTEAEDRELADILLNDEKEIAEHNMLVDLVRNDVGRVSRFGSVKIEKLMYIKKLSHVQHICSLISGSLSGSHDAFNALQAAFPTGTLVGAPKIEAAKMIRELEAYERGPYGGAVGYFSYSGDSMHAVNIRSVNAAGNKLFLHTGSGIVYDSRPSHEYQEILAKKLAMDQAMRPFLNGDKS